MRLGIDISGTFTDFVLLDGREELSTDVERINTRAINIRSHPFIRFAEGNPLIGEHHAFRH